MVRDVEGSLLFLRLFPEDQARVIFLQLPGIIEYLRELSLSHRNANRENALLDERFRISVVGWSSLTNSSLSITVSSFHPHRPFQDTNRAHKR
jgi:hypothetical protein